MPAMPAHVFTMRLTERAERVITRAAKRRGMPVSSYVREVALEQARRENAAHRQARAIRHAAVEAAEEGV